MNQSSHAGPPASSARPRRLLALAIAGLAMMGLLAPAAGHAAVTAFGSPLAVPATLNTADDLHYAGQNYQTSQNGQTTVTHVNHDGSDTILFNTRLASGTPQAPAQGQITSVSLEGCAQPAPNGPAPLTEIHFQAVTPRSDGSYLVDATSEQFNIPVCGSGVDGNTVTTYNLKVRVCVNAGDYVDFNDAGGFDPNAYPSGVKYQVIGSVPGSTMVSFINPQGGVGNVNNVTGTGGTFNPGEGSNNNGFAVNNNEELLERATLATGPDANQACGGSAGGTTLSGPPATPNRHQRDGVNRKGIVRVAVFCHAGSGCHGSAVLGARGQMLGTAPFSTPHAGTIHLPIKLGRASLRALRRTHHGHWTVSATVTSGGQTATGPVILFG